MSTPPAHPVARSLSECVRAGAHDLTAAGHDPAAARLDAGVLARHVLQWDAATWLSRQREEASVAFRAAFDRAIERRRAHEPVAYITGTREFYGRPFAVSSGVLIPRPETELVVDEALSALSEIAARKTPGASLRSERAEACPESAGLKPGGDEGPCEALEEQPRPAAPRVADVGTGSGCLAVTLALESPTARITATDISDAALAVAVENALRLGVEGRIAFRRTSLLGGAVGAFDVIVSNPPYVPARDRLALAPDVRDYEPATALFGGDDGLDVIRALLPAAARALAPGGWLVMEIGADQAERLSDLVGATGGLSLVRIAPDLAGIPRVVVARQS